MEATVCSWLEVAVCHWRSSHSVQGALKGAISGLPGSLYKMMCRWLVLEFRTPR